MLEIEILTVTLELKQQLQRFWPRIFLFFVFFFVVFTWNEYLQMMQHLPQLHDKNNRLSSPGRPRVFRE